MSGGKGISAGTGLPLSFVPEVLNGYNSFTFLLIFIREFRGGPETNNPEMEESE